MALGDGGISVDGKVEPGQKERLASEHERENVGMATGKNRFQGLFVV